MNETVSVDEAIAKGRRMLMYPGYVILCVSFGVFIYLMVEKNLPNWCYVPGVLLVFVPSCIWWAVMTTKWRIWAFEHVRNVHELKERAIQERLIGRDNSFYVKLEIRSSLDKERLALLEDRFRQDDVFEDDLTIPDETIIYYSKKKNLWEMLLMLFCMAIGIYFFIESNSRIFGLIMTIAGAYLGYREYKEATDTEPQIILNEKGIKTISTDFYAWNEIDNEEAIMEGYGKDSHCYLNYNHPNGSEYLKIDDYDIDQRSLNKLLILYRSRSQKRVH